MKARFLSMCVGLLATSISGCAFQSQKKMTQQQYEWTPSTCAPISFPIALLEGGFKLSDGSSAPLSKDAYTGKGWGEIGSLMLVGDDIKTLPDSLSVDWFSYKERRFFRGSFDLDQDKLQAHFKSGYSNPNTGEHTTYKFILVGFAPGGGLAVWLIGDGLSKEVAYMKADAYNGDVKQLIGAAASLEEFVQLATEGKLSRAEMQPVQAGDTEYKKWSEAYRDTHPFSMHIASGAPVKSAIIHYFNGEKNFLRTEDMPQYISRRSLPRNIIVRWIDNNNENTTTEITLDEGEIFSAFKNLPSTPDKSIKLQITLNAVSFECGIYLENGTDKITLSKLTSKTF